MTKSKYTLMLLIAGLFFITNNTFAQRKLSLTAEQAIETGLQNIDRASSYQMANPVVAIPVLQETGIHLCARRQL